MNAYILAGGFSRRMDRDKTLLPFRGKPLIVHLYGLVSQFFPTYVVAKDTEKYLKLGIEKVIPDLFMQIQSPAVGIYTGLKHSPHGFNLFLSADLPLLCQNYLSFVKGYRFEEKFLGFIPTLGGKKHYTCGVYSKKLIPLLEKAIKRGELSLKRFEKYFLLWEENFLEKQGIPPECCFNLNTPWDLEFLKLNEV
ncbi:MAG: hypothetical protein DSZ30_01685 [Aquificaceae bacterium]|nr:MAG: hypothetical protein DSZ30_01685 [Aquificaceae bacterium]